MQGGASTSSIPRWPDHGLTEPFSEVVGLLLSCIQLDARRQSWRCLDTIQLPGGGSKGAHVTSSGFDGELDRVRRELRDLAATTEGEPPEGYGEAAEGMVVVTAVNGRLSSVELNPRALRLASHELAEAFAAAANAALTDMESRYAVPAYPSFDPGRLDAQLAEIQEQSARQKREYQQTIDDALRQLGP